MGQEQHKGCSVPRQESSCHKIHFAHVREQYRGQNTVASLKSAFFNNTVFKIIQAQKKTFGRAEWSSCKCHEQAQVLAERRTDFPTPSCVDFVVSLIL